MSSWHGVSTVVELVSRFGVEVSRNEARAQNTVGMTFWGCVHCEPVMSDCAPQTLTDLRQGAHIPGDCGKERPTCASVPAVAAGGGEMLELLESSSRGPVEASIRLLRRARF